MLKSERLLSDYLEFSRLRSDALATKELDLSTIHWFYPTLLLPLGVFIRQNKNIRVTPPKDSSVSSYFDIITETNKTDGNKSYIPIIKVPESKDKSDTILEKLGNFAADCGGITSLGYFIGELVDNIYQHSSFSTAYVMAQKYQSMGFLEFCLIDNGISIPQSYENVGIPIKNDKVALDYALEGKSTKKNTERGRGLRDSIKLITLGMNGVCLIVSRKGGLRASHEEKASFDIYEKNIYEGTLISINVPFQEKEVCIYEYIQ